MMHRQVTIYTKGRDRVELIRSIRDVPVHVFGTNHLCKNWHKYLGNQPNVHYHDAVNFAESMRVMKQSKILLNGAPQFMHGLHERIFNGLNAGALVLTNKNMVLDKYFTSGEELITYPLSDYSQVNEQVSYFVHNAQERYAIVGKGREKVLSAHTWDHRAKSFLENVSRILQERQVANV
jgi:spore maturation protein CgeB